MGKKRKKNANNGSSSYNDFNSKRPRQSEDSNNLANDFRAPGGYIDQSTGQRGAFPGLSSNEDFYGPANDGIDYLRMVRSEAKHVPQLLIGKLSTAPPPPKAQPSKKKKKPPPPIVEEEVVLDYDDPPYEAPPTVQEDAALDYGDSPQISTTADAAVEAKAEEPVLDHEEAEFNAMEEQETETIPPSTPGTSEQDSDPTISFSYDSFGTYASLRPSLPGISLPPWQASLLDRFRKLRKTLHTTLAPTSSHPAPPGRIKKGFRSHIDENPVSTNIIWTMDQMATLQAVEWLTYFLNERRRLYRGVPKNWAGWIWGLLVRIDDCLAADEVVTVRELGKVALDILRQASEWKKEHKNDAGDGNQEEAISMKSNETEIQLANEEIGPTVANIGEEAVNNTEALGTTETEQPKPEEDDDNDASESEKDDEEHLSLKELQQKLPLALEPTSLAVFEMIVAIVGDFFGQRDLLEERATLQDLD